MTTHTRPNTVCANCGGKLYRTTEWSCITCQPPRQKLVKDGDALRSAVKDLLEAYDGMLWDCDDPEDGCSELWHEYIRKLKELVGYTG